MKLIKLQCAYRLRVFQYELQFALLVLLIAVKFSARIVVIHLTALLECLHDCSIRVFNLDNPPTYNNHGAKNSRGPSLPEMSSMTIEIWQFLLEM